MRYSFLLIAFLLAALNAWARPVDAGESVRELSIARISEHTLEIRIGPAGMPAEPSPMLVDFPREQEWRGPVEEAPPTVEPGGFRVEIERSPLTITVWRKDGERVQRLAWQEDGSVAFKTDAPVFGLGENGARWDRRGAEYPMAPRWGSDTQGSVVPSPLLIGADGWALLLPQPDGSFDLRGDRGRFLARKPTETFLCYLIDWKQPADVLAEYVRLTGRPLMPPKWALGYMQSHRTLTGWDEVQQVAKTFRDKKLPCDALIYLSEVYCKQGWGNGQTPFRWNKSSFPDPAANLDTLHALDFKALIHVAKYPKTLHGGSVAETSDDPAHIANFWKQHASTYQLGVDGWWPDDGDDLAPEGRMARHRCYFEGPLTLRPNVRPWSLHRTGVAGMARYGGWLWSGDTESRWATLAAQIPVGLGASLSISPFWGSDAGGFFPRKEYTGELFVRWFQFAAFTPSFRSHGRTWHLHLPWGWNTGEPGPIEEKEVCDASEFHNAEVEPACRETLNLRYRLLPYNYTLAREACDTGLPMMRALWLHHPDEAEVVTCKDAFLWGRDLLVAPVVKKGATTRKLRLPRGIWFDWWTGEAHEGGREITRDVDLATLPLFARAGAIIPLDPVRQFTAEQVTEPTEVRVYPGADGDFTLYDDDGQSMEYLKKDGTRIRFRWNDTARTLTIEPVNEAAAAVRRTFSVRVMPGTETNRLDYRGEKTSMVAAVDTHPERPSGPFHVRIGVDAAGDIGPLPDVWRFFGADEPNYATMPHGQKLLGELGELRPRQVFFRAHNLLTTGDGTPALKWGSTNAYTEDSDGRPIYDWKILDGIFDAYLARGVRPYAQIGFMPKALSVKPEPYGHDFTKEQTPNRFHNGEGWAHPPKDFSKWEKLVEAWVRHCVDRYGADEVARWYWQTWNEPNIRYWRGTHEEFFRLHDHAIAAVRRVLPAARVGGPDTAQDGGAFMDEFLDHCLHGTNFATGDRGTPLDFVSFHAKGKPETVDGHVRMGSRHHLATVDAGFRRIAKHRELRRTPIVIGESDPEGCAACEGPQLAYRNGTMYSSYTASTFPRKLALAERVGVKLEGVLTWAFEFEGTPWFAGFRTLATNGVDKPVLNVFRMWSRMAGRRLPVESDGEVPLDALLAEGVSGRPDVSAIASRDGESLWVMAWHYHDDDVPGPEARVTLRIPGWSGGALPPTHYRIDRDHSNAFARWQRMGSPQEPTAEQYRELDDHDGLEEAKAPDVRLDGETLVVDLPLPRAAVSLLEWRPVSHRP